MPLRSAGLGLKLNLALFVFFVVLAVATLGVVAYGFKRTQDNAKTRSSEALQELGKLALRAVAGGVAEQGGVRFESASEVGQRAGREMEAFRRSGATPAFDATNLAVTDGGIHYDSSPTRISDFVALPYVNLADPAVQDEIAYSAALDSVFDALFEGFEDQVGGRNFDPHAIGFVGVNGTGRYYPPRGIQATIPPDLDISNVLDRAGPTANPNRLTTWTHPYEDALGQGLVVTAETPIYEGDTYRGVIQVDLLITRLINEIDGIRPTPGGFAFYVDLNGDLQHTAAYDLLTTEAATAAFADILERMKTSDSDAEIVVESVQLNGEEFLVAHVAMPSLGGSIAVAAPVSEITAEAEAITAGIDREANRTLLAMSAALGALFLAGLAGAGYLNRRVVLNPIGALLQGTRAVGAGDLTTNVDVRSKDELGDLASGFNAMVGDLRETETRYQRVFESTSDGFTISRLDGTIVEANAAACEMHGYNREEFLRLPSGAHVHPDFRERRLRFQDEVRQGRSYTVRAVDIRKDGSSFDVDVRGVPFEYRGELHVLSVIRDVTAEVRQEQMLEDRVEERTRELELLLNVSRNVAATLDIDRLAARILDQLHDVLPYGGAGLLLFEGDDLVMLDARSVDGTRDEGIIGQHIPPPVPGPAGEAIERRAPVVVVDALADPEMAARRSEVPGPASEGRSWLAAPLIAQERVLGLLTLWSPDPGVYDAQDAELAMAVANQAAIAVENARLFQQASVVAAVEERQRLARELHDSVSQALYGIALGAQTAKQLLAADPSKAAQPVDYVLSLADTGLAEMRALIFELRPESLATEGLVSAIEKQAAATSARYGLAVRPSLPAEPDAPLATKEALYRVAQEAVHNAVKHARASTITVALSASNGALHLEVVDDGVGFEANGDFPGHLGLRSMAERAESVGGALSIESAPGAGTRVTATVPV